MSIDEKLYYSKIFGKLENCFNRSHFILGAGQELIRYGWDPNRPPLVWVQPKEKLYDFTVNMGLEVFLPVLACIDDWHPKRRPEKVEAIIWPFDFEIFLQDFTKLYCNPASQAHFFVKHIKPVKDYLAWRFESNNIPYLLDYTPSGGHFLMYILRGSPAWNGLLQIGYEDQEVLAQYDIDDPTDLKRNPKPDLETALVYSGLCILTEYISLKAITDIQDNGYPITIWDTEEKCVNLDISWTADPAYMRIIRSPFGLHKKRNQKYLVGPEPLVDIVGRQFDGHNLVAADENEGDLWELVHHMWDMDRALSHAQSFHGFIPFANENLCNLTDEYRHSPLAEFYNYAHGHHDLPPGEAEKMALSDPLINPKTKFVIKGPNPRMLQPSAMRKFVGDLLYHGWHPRHIKCLIADKYNEEWQRWPKSFGYKYSSNKQAWAMTRQFAAQRLVENGELFL